MIYEIGEIAGDTECGTKKEEVSEHPLLEHREGSKKERRDPIRKDRRIESLNDKGAILR